MIEIGVFIGTVIGVLILGLVVGFFASRWFFKRQLQKNPPINEKMIRALYSQMGRKPSEAQVRQAMKAMNQYK